MMIVLICIQSKAWFFDLLCISKNQIEEHCKSLRGCVDAFEFLRD